MNVHLIQPSVRQQSLPSIDRCFALLVTLRPSHAKAELEHVVFIRGP